MQFLNQKVGFDCWVNYLYCVINNNNRFVLIKSLFINGFNGIRIVNALSL